MSDNHHDHDHAHDHDKTFVPDEEESLGHYAIVEMAMRELLVEKGLVSADEFRRALEWYDKANPALGASIIARAWREPDFKQALIEKPGDTVAEYGITMGHVELYVVENTDELHNVIVCTLCSCYPRPLLGIPPDWYKSRSFRSRVVHEPRAVLREFGTELPDDVEVRVHDSTADLRYLVLPLQPDGTKDWSVDELAKLVTRDTMIGVSLPNREVTV
jgi:nitrile hydratase alpha subunit